MKSVLLAFGYGRGYNYALDIGLPVKQIKHEGFLDSEMLSRLLSSCPRVETLDLCLFVGAERALLEAGHVLPNMHSLRLCWEGGECIHGNEMRACPKDNCQPLVIPGVLLDIAAGCLKLRQLQLNSVAISLSEVQAIMESMGSRLNVFGICAAGQYEKQYDYLEAILSFAATHNPRLRVLHAFVDLDDEDDADNVLDVRQGRRILSALERLPCELHPFNIRSRRSWDEPRDESAYCHDHWGGPQGGAREVERVSGMWPASGSKRARYHRGMGNVKGWLQRSSPRDCA